jgi:hypothetical protein
MVRVAVMLLCKVRLRGEPKLTKCHNVCYAVQALPQGLLPELRQKALSEAVQQGRVLAAASFDSTAQKPVSKGVRALVMPLEALLKACSSRLQGLTEPLIELLTKIGPVGKCMLSCPQVGCISEL